MKQEGSYEGDAEEEGDFKLCLDNKVSTISEKTVWFEIQVDDPDDDYYDDDDSLGKNFQFRFVTL